MKWLKVSYETSKPVSVNQFFVVIIPNSKNPCKSIFQNNIFLLSVAFFLHRVEPNKKSGTWSMCWFCCQCCWSVFNSYSAWNVQEIHDLVAPNRTHYQCKKWILRSCTLVSIYLRYNLNSLLTLYRHNMKNTFFRWSCWQTI